MATSTPNAGIPGAEPRGRAARFGALAPRGLRRLIGLVYGRVARGHLDWTVHRILRDDEPILVGPYLSEIGFELLYWIPFLRWLTSQRELDPRRVIALSRGGADPWYDGICDRYVDVLDLMTAEEYADKNRRRAVENRGQKAMRITGIDRQITELALQRVHDGSAHRLHPALMFRLFRPWFWGFTDLDWVLSQTRHHRLGSPRRERPPSGLDGPYVAAKFYFNEGFPDTLDNRRLAEGLIERVARHIRVVHLDTEHALDEHREYRPEHREQSVLRERATARNNLMLQTEVILGACFFIGTYGGFAYLAPSCDVSTVAIYTNGSGFHSSHLKMAEAALDEGGLSGLSVVDGRSADIDGLATRIARAATTRASREDE